MLRKHISLHLIIVLFCLVALGCSSDSKGHSLSDVDTWNLTFQAGYGQDDQSPFEPYYWRCVSESEWNRVKDKVIEDQSELRKSWSEMETKLKSWSIENNTIIDIKSKLAADEKATYFYKNTSDRCRWIRILKN
jgi:uncharacterized protein YcfL